MANAPALAAYDQLIDDISVLYEGARKALVTAYWQIGQRDLAVSVWSAALKVPAQATFKAFLSQKLLNDCAIDLRSTGYEPGQHIQKGYEDLDRWVNQRQVPEDLKAVAF